MCDQNQYKSEKAIGGTEVNILILITIKTNDYVTKDNQTKKLNHINTRQDCNIDHITITQWREDQTKKGLHSEI